MLFPNKQKSNRPISLDSEIVFFSGLPLFCTYPPYSENSTTSQGLRPFRLSGKIQEDGQQSLETWEGGV
jgi:hypothetical protein